jgi:SAM-dependent methyltransferase
VNPVEWVHDRYVKRRREHALAVSIAAVIPRNARVLDVGCGDGSLAAAILRHRPDLSVRGLEVMARTTSHIPVTVFDGTRLPFPDGDADVVLFVDVLHHTTHAEALLQEARRVARDAIIVKEHCADGFLAWPILRFMDRVGNARFGVALPHLYRRWTEWQSLFARIGVVVTSLQRRIGLYPWPLNWLFERSLHFVARLEPTGGRA